MTLFYDQNSTKFSLNSSAILHFRDSKLKNFPYKASQLQRSTRAAKLQSQASPKHKKIGTLSVHVGSLNEVSEDTPNYNCTSL